MIWRVGCRFLSNSAMDFLNCPSNSCLCNEAGPYKDPAICGEVNPTISYHDPIVWIMKPRMIILYLENIHLNSTSFITSNKHQTVSVFLIVNQLIFGSFRTNDFFVEIDPASELLPWTRFPFWGGNVTQDRINYNFRLGCCHFFWGGCLFHVFSTLLYRGHYITNPNNALL